LRPVFKLKLINVMLNHYETVFITTPVLSESQMKEAVEKFKGILTDNDAKIVHEENWGLRKLAYPIQKKSTGFYYLIEFESEGGLIDKLETEYRRDERIIRFLTVRLDKYGVEYTERKRTKKAEEAEKIKEEES
jgi:small subunit ribosomal protein S6